MSIDPVPAAQGFVAAERKGSATGAAPTVAFEELLAKSGASQQPVSVATAAEILRLKMLGSAMSIGESDKGASESSMGVQGLLERFLAQLPQNAGSAGSAGSAEAGASAGQAPGGEAAEAVEGGQVAGTLAGGEGGATAVPLSTQAIIDKAAARYGVDAGLIKAVIKAESNFNPRAVSSAGAQGLMQLMPSTARGLGVTDSFNPEQNVMAGTRFLKDLLQRYGNVDEALAAYNWGPGNVDRHGTDRLPRETRAYLGKVKGYMETA